MKCQSILRKYYTFSQKSVCKFYIIVNYCYLCNIFYKIVYSIKAFFKKYLIRHVLLNKTGKIEMKLSVQDILTNKYFINEAVLSFSILNVVDVVND